MNNEQSGGTSGSSKSIERTTAEIERSRSVIGEDIRAIGEKLSPEHLKEVARETAAEARDAAVEKLDELKDAATDKVRGMKQAAVDSLNETYEEVRDNALNAGRVTADFVARNAVPLALVGIGATWLWAQNSGGRARARRQRGWTRGENGGSRTSSGASSVRRVGREVTEGIAHAGQRVREQASHAEQALSAAGQHAMEFASHEIDEVKERSSHLMEEKPLLVGALALAAGVGVGMLLPHSAREDALFGEARDQLLGGAKETLGELKQAAKEAVENVGTTLTGAAPG